MELRTLPATAKGPETTFTGDVWLDRIAGGDDESRLVPATVRFPPARVPIGTRTRWARPCTAPTESAWSGLATAE